jgi:Mlc titration factor MtfA (ptsG expression regulator)
MSFLVNLGNELLKKFADQFQVHLPTESIPASWPAIVEKNVPLSHALDDAERERLLRIAQLLIREVPFEGCKGLEITEEIQVAIAASAAMLLVRRSFPKFLRLERILVYPDSFVAYRIRDRRSLDVERQEQGLEGEAWGDGIVVIAWVDVLAAASPAPPHGNVALHEFAHVLDFEDGSADGTPLLESEQARAKWRAIFQREFEQLEKDIEADRPAILDDYAATNLAEFFAVATETYFLAPERLKAGRPELFTQLDRFYRPGAGNASPG